MSTELDRLQKTARKAPFVWTDEDERIFERVKSLLSDESYLSLFIQI